MTTENFENMNLREELLRGIFSYGYEKPSSIQQKSIMPILTGKDIIVQSQSGTGKTACFTISILQTIDETKNYAQALVMAPTRELAIQISTVITVLGNYIDNLKICTCIGGIKTNFHELKNAQIIVGTPGRIFDVISNKNLNVSNLKMFVLDEADEMLSPGFTEQVQDIFKLITDVQNDFQKVILSATLSPEIIEITEHFMDNPIQILVKNDALTLEGIKQYYINVDKEDWKIDTLYDLYNNISVAQTIMFVNSKKKIEWVYDMMKKKDYPVSLIHSDLEQSERNEILKNFKNGNIRMLLSTDLFARGIDVQQVSLVINYDLPKNLENYIHRIGRSGRFGKKGVSINFITNDDINYQKSIETFYNTQIEELPANVNDIII
jgi:translation initiation factor 4A